MVRIAFIAGSALLAISGMGQNVETVQTIPGPGSTTPPVAIVRPAPSNSPYVYNQQVRGSRPILITLDQANAIVDKFKVAYAKLNSPRLMVLLLSPELANEKNGNTNGIAQVAGEPASPSFFDRQSTREVERLFGRPLRMAGATLSDQWLGLQQASGRPPESLTKESAQARKDREALSKIAEVAIEVLITAKDVTVAEVSGDRTYSLPEIQATAVRLQDARVLAQASSYDVTSRYAPSMVRQFSFPELAETTALVLMEDFLNNLPSTEEKK